MARTHSRKVLDAIRESVGEIRHVEAVVGASRERSDERFERDVRDTICGGGTREQVPGAGKNARKDAPPVATTSAASASCESS